ncbi:hypothetical protein R80B4_02292 [Fibrobacteres bacterium R8-0-B4]
MRALTLLSSDTVHRRSTAFFSAGFFSAIIVSSSFVFAVRNFIHHHISLSSPVWGSLGSSMRWTSSKSANSEPVFGSNSVYRWWYSLSSGITVWLAMVMLTTRLILLYLSLLTTCSLIIPAQ